MVAARQSGVLPLAAYGLLVAVGLACVNWLVVVRVAGGSMVPALLPGDIAVVTKAQPRAGDIALLRSGSSLVLHRVARVLGDGSVSTRGDANPIADFSPTPRAAIRGRVALVLPFGATLARWRGGDACAKLPAQPHSSRQ
jgi:signal peptidase I